MRFSSNAPTTPTTTTSIDVIEVNLSGKRGSTTVASHDQPIQVVDIDLAATAQHLNGTTTLSQAIDDNKCINVGGGGEKVQEIMNANAEYIETPPLLNDDDGNV